MGTITKKFTCILCITSQAAALRVENSISEIRWLMSLGNIIVMCLAWCTLTCCQAAADDAQQEHGRISRWLKCKDRKKKK